MAKKDGVISISSGQVSLQPQTKFDNTLQTDVFTGFTSSIQLSAIVKGEIVCELAQESFPRRTTSCASFVFGRISTSHRVNQK